MEVITLGTCSQKPSPTRNVSCNIIKLRNNKYIVIDCGEGTQHQFLKFKKKISNIELILITHLHGDHIFGLPGLLSSLNESKEGSNLNIIGPYGLSKFLKNVLFFGHYANLRYKLNITELNDRKMNYYNPIIKSFKVIGGYPNIDIYAIPTNHVEYTYSYVIEEQTKKGSLIPKVIDPILDGNKKLYKNISQINKKNFEYNGFIFDNEGYVHFKDKKTKFRNESVSGIKISVISDTNHKNDSGLYLNTPFLFQKLVNNSDVIVHEATNCISCDYENISIEKEKEVRDRIISHGHSTPDMAGSFANIYNAKLLILTHFSSKYKGDIRIDSLLVMEKIRNEAIKTFKSNNVITARDGMVIPISNNYEKINKIVNTNIFLQICAVNFNKYITIKFIIFIVIFIFFIILIK